MSTITAKKLAKVSICPNAFSISTTGYSELDSGAIVIGLDDYSIEFVPHLNGNNSYSDNTNGFRFSFIQNRFRMFNNITGNYKDFSRDKFLSVFGTIPYADYSTLNIYHLTGNKFVVFVRKRESGYHTVYGCVGEIEEDFSITWGTVYTLQNNVWGDFTKSTVNKIAFAVFKVGNLFLQPTMQYTGNSSSPSSISVANSLICYSVTGTAISTVQTISMRGSSPLTSNNTNQADFGYRNIYPISETEAHFYVKETVSPSYSIYKISVSNNTAALSTILEATSDYSAYQPISTFFTHHSLQPFFMCGKSVFGASVYDYNVYDAEKKTYEQLTNYIGYNGNNVDGGSVSEVDGSMFGFYKNFANVSTENGVIATKQKLFNGYDAYMTGYNTNSPNFNGFHASRCLYGFKNWLCCVDLVNSDGAGASDPSKEEIFFKPKYSNGVLHCDGYLEEKTLVTGEAGKVKQITSICVGSKVHGKDTTLSLRDSSGDLITCKIDDIPNGVLNFANHPLIISEGDSLKAEMICGFGDVTITVFGIEEVIV